MINGPAGVKAHSPDCPGRRTGTAALGWAVGGRMCSCHCSGVGHHQRTRSTEDAVGAARRKEIASFWAAPLHLYLREAAKGPGAVTAGSSTDCLGLLVSFQGSWGQKRDCPGTWDILHLENTISIHILFSSATCYTTSRPVAAFLLVRNGSKIYFPQFRMMFLWGLFLTSFPDCNNLLSWGHVFILSYFTDLTV